MGNCLVTTLKESVNDTSLLHLGEMRLHVKPYKYVEGYPPRIVLQVSTPTTVTIEGDGYFTDQTGSANLGKQINVTAQYVEHFLSTGEYDLVIGNKYNIINLVTIVNVPALWIAEASYVDGDTESFSGAKIKNIRVGIGNLVGALKDFDDVIGTDSETIILTSWGIDSHGLTGDLSDLKEYASLNSLSLGIKELTGDIGNLARICPNVTNLNVTDCKVTGTLSSLAGLSNLQSLNLTGDTFVTGDTSDLANLTNLTTFVYTNTAITGTWPLV